MNDKKEMSPGFTLIELLIVLAVTVVILGVSMPFLLSFHAYTLLNDAAEQVTHDLRRAQTKAVAGSGTDVPQGRANGVFFDVAAETWVVFEGPSYVSGAPSNEVHVLPPVVDLVSVNLTGGTAAVFAERSGRTANPGTVVLRSGLRELTITLCSSGSVTMAATALSCSAGSWGTFPPPTSPPPLPTPPP